MPDLVSKLALVKEGKMLSTEYAIEVARRPEFVERARQLKMSQELVINVLADVVWDVVMDLPSVFAGKFDQSLAQYYATTPQEEKGTRLRCPECKKLFRTQGLGIHMRKMHGSGIKSKTKKSLNPMQECPQCHKQFKGLVGLGSHLAKIHGIRGKGVTQTNPAKQAVTKKEAPEEVKESRPINKMPSDMITDCPTCKEVGFRAVRYNDHYDQVGGQPIREYWYGLVHETASKKLATFHRQAKLTNDAAKKRAEKYHQFDPKGEVVIPSSQQKQSLFFAKKEQ